jgi:excinuclease ABC subunit B
MNPFEISAPYSPAGDQPKAITALTEGVNQGMHGQTLLGVTGSGKTFSIAHVIQNVQKPTLVIAHNKTLAAQLTTEFRQFFPKNAVEYFVSYYDYYQPEAYVPNSDTYIEKEAQINDEIDRLRHSATQALLTRRDVIVVASVSCIYGIGRPEAYGRYLLTVNKGEAMGREAILARLVELQFTRSDLQLSRGTFRSKGDVIEIMPVNRELVFRIELFGDVVEHIRILDPITMKEQESLPQIIIYPAKHFMLDTPDQERAFHAIEYELKSRVAELKTAGKLLEAERLERRTKYDLEMMREVGYCSGIENYSRHLDGRKPNDPPSTLISYFPKDFLLVVDESHVTIPQIRGMYAGDRARKNTLVDFGFRLPSAKDNRPLQFDEFKSYINQTIYVSATPADYETENSDQIVEQIIRPTGLVDPKLTIHPSEGQIAHLHEQIKKRVDKEERTLVTTLTKKMAEDLTEYFIQQGLKVRYLHSDVETLERIQLLRDLRRGLFDVLVGVNLLREGLDLPEVSLVAILDADKEGFLRSDRSLIQTIGRAARNVEGEVLLYADVMTRSLKSAIGETERRRKIQLAYNEAHNITPQTIQREIASIVEDREVSVGSKLDSVEKEMARGNLDSLIKQKEREMKSAAKDLQFELAALLRDELQGLRKLQREKVFSVLQ